jgi:hypothetical protein
VKVYSGVRKPDGAATVFEGDDATGTKNVLVVGANWGTAAGRRTIGKAIMGGYSRATVADFIETFLLPVADQTAWRIEHRDIRAWVSSVVVD